MKELFEKLQAAKEAVGWLLEHPSGLVCMHGIGYWASEVERLREEIKQKL